MELHPIKEDCAIRYAKMMDYEAIPDGYKTLGGTKISMKKMIKILEEIGFIKQDDGNWGLDEEKIRKTNKYLRDKAIAGADAKIIQNNSN